MDTTPVAMLPPLLDGGGRGQPPTGDPDAPQPKLSRARPLLLRTAAATRPNLTANSTITDLGSECKRLEPPQMEGALTALHPKLTLPSASCALRDPNEGNI